MTDGLILALFLISWGAQAVVPWRLARRREPRRLCREPRRLCHEPRRLWAWAALPLAAAGALAALLWVRAYPDAALAAGLVPLAASMTGRALAVLTLALAAADLVAVFGWKRLEDAGWRILAGFGLAALGAACLAAEMLRAGEGPASPLPVLALAAACRLLVGLAAGEVLAPGRPRLAVAAAPALAAYFFVIPAELVDGLLRGGGALTAGAAALLFLAVRWLPVSLRRPGLAAAALLAGLFFAQAAATSQSLGGPVIPPLPPLPGPG
jgi:hypothetical protein